MMRNADRPTHPVPAHQRAPSQSNTHPVLVPEEYGLTKREEFAKAAMQGILANQNYSPPRRDRLAGMAKDAVAAADALLAELEKTS